MGEGCTRARWDVKDERRRHPPRRFSLTALGRHLGHVEIVDLVHGELLNAADEAGQVGHRVRILGRRTAHQQALPPERNRVLHVGVVCTKTESPLPVSTFVDRVAPQTTLTALTGHRDVVHF